MESTHKWFALRVPYSRELKLKVYFDSLGITNYIPFRIRHVEKDGEKVEKTEPAIHNLIFVRSSRPQIDALMVQMEGYAKFRYIVDKSTRSPIIIRAREMDNFIAVTSTMNKELIYLKQVDPSLKLGERVLIADGIFKGIEGHIVRIKKDRRVLISVQGVAAVATAFIPSDLLVPTKN